MENIIHPVSGERGFFCTILEKEVIDKTLESIVDTTCSESSVRNG